MQNQGANGVFYYTKMKESGKYMKLFTLLMICLLANHFLGWSLLWLTLVAVMACTIEKMIDRFVKIILHKLTRSVVKDIVGVAVKELNEGYEKYFNEILKD